MRIYFSPKIRNEDIVIFFQKIGIKYICFWFNTKRENNLTRPTEGRSGGDQIFSFGITRSMICSLSFGLIHKTRWNNSTKALRLTIYQLFTKKPTLKLRWVLL